MKIVVCAFFVLMFSQNLASQTAKYLHPKTLSVGFVLYDFETPESISASSFRQSVKDSRFFRFKKMMPGLALNYTQGLTSNFDASLSLNGAFLDYPLKDRAPFSKNSLLVDMNASVKAKLLSNRFMFTPYLQGGVGSSGYRNYYGIYIPLGLGVQFNVRNEVFVTLSSEYRSPLTTKTVSGHFLNSIGIAGKISGRKKKSASTTLSQPFHSNDRDNDGIQDNADMCPDVKGIVQFEGCPDRDGDSIPDKTDRCPDVFGLISHQGCPIPDTDGDGIVDDRDSCKNQVGVARFNGCPIPDRDKDGVNDETDGCPDVAGTVTDNGCPAISVSLRKKVDLLSSQIFFETGSSRLQSKSFDALNQLVGVLRKENQLKIFIEGHTDNVGTSEKNQVLSEQRAATVVEYLVAHGIDRSRLSSQGFGDQRPVAENNSADGRRKNRRVEMRVGYE